MSQQLVAQIKAQLEAKGMDLSGPCGAFQITKRVAWALRAQGAGLLSKPSGNNCEGYAVDIVMFPDGTGVDCLSDGGGSNGPTWGATEIADGVSRYRPAVDPGDTPDPVPPPPLPPPPPPVPQPVDLQPILNAIASLQGQVAAQHLAQARSFEVMDAWFRQVLAKQDRAYTGNTKAFGGALVLRPKDE